MTIKLTRIRYKQLNARQKESYSFQKISAVLAVIGSPLFNVNNEVQTT